jgi:Porin subfamily
VGSRGDADYNAFVGRFLVSHTTGPWLFQAQYAYASGQDADDDINNRGIGRRADVKTYRALTTDGSPVWNDWFEILGRSEVDGTSLQTFRRWAESGTADRFGWQVLAGATEYQLTDSLILEGAVGGFWTAKKTACPANLRVGSLTGPCGGPLNASGEPIYNFTGNSRFMGWEVAAGFRYTILPGLTWTPRLAYADYGDAVAMNNRSPLGAWSFSNRMVYIF